MHLLCTISLLVVALYAKDYENGLTKSRRRFKDIVLTSNCGWKPFIFGNGGSLSYNRFIIDLDKPAIFKITDAYCNGDTFSLYDNGKLLGVVSPSLGTEVDYCQIVEKSPEKAFHNGIFASGRFKLKRGKHHIYIKTEESAIGGGYGFAKLYQRKQHCRKPSCHTSNCRRREIHPHRQHTNQKPCREPPTQEHHSQHLCPVEHHSESDREHHPEHSRSHSDRTHSNNPVRHRRHSSCPKPQQPHTPSCQFKIIAPVNFAFAEAGCQAIGMHLARLTSTTFSEASRFVFDELGPKSLVWIQSYNGDDYRNACLVFSVGEFLPNGNVNVSPGCEIALPVLCQQ